MSSPIYKGEQLREGPKEATWKVGTGGQTVRTFTGPPDLIAAKASELQLLGYETRIIEGSPHSLTATYNVDLITNPGGDVGHVEPEPAPQWEVIPHDIEQSIFETGRQFVYQLPSDVKAAIEAKIKNPQNKSLFVVPPEYNAGTFGNLDQLVDDAFRIYIMALSGITSRRINTISLKRTITVSNNYAANWSIVYNNTVLSTAKVKALYNVPTWIWEIIPESYGEYENVPINKSEAVRNQYVTLPWYYGWLESRPSYQTVGSTKKQISQEWIWGKWLAGPNGLYDLVT